MDDANTELEQFRQQWRAEVSARTQHDGRDSKSTKIPRKPPPITSLASSRVTKPSKEEDDDVEPHVYESFDGALPEPEHAESSKGVAKEPQSALEHYEKAVERETAGNLGDSLDLYRKAFRVRSGLHYQPKLLTSSFRWMIELIKNTKANTFHPPTLLRNLPTRTRRTPQLQYPIPPTTP